MHGLAYLEDKFVIGIDTENALEAGFTGMNTRAGDLLTVNGNTPDQRQVALLVMTMSQI